MNVKEKFIELTQYTEVLGQEGRLRKYLPDGCIEDEVGNYYIKIGESNTLFTAHLDTAAYKMEKVNHEFDRIQHKDGNGYDEFIETDKTTILGADDRAGVVVLLYMIEHNVPGLYYFFIGEESGMVGSNGILNSNPEFFDSYKKCISFDRKGYGSIISRQMGDKCCSDEFVVALGAELTEHVGYTHKDDPGGIFTDSAAFIDCIEECTNISVGYFNQHSHDEYQNITYLENLCKGVIKVNWENLPIVRDYTPFDTPNPKRNPKGPNDLPDKELKIIFDMVEDMIEDVFRMDCINRYYFIPEKEMVFQHYYKDTRFSCWIHEDGSITINTMKFDDVYDLEDQLKTHYGYDPHEDEDEEENNTSGSTSVSTNKDDDSFSLDKDTFEDGLNVDNFILNIENLNKEKISATEMDNILDKYNKSIESLIIWLYNRENDPSKTHGLMWDDTSNGFLIYPER